MYRSGSSFIWEIPNEAYIRFQRIKFSSSCGFHWTGTSLRNYEIAHPPLRLPPTCSYLFLPSFPFTSAFSVLAYMWETDLVLEPPKHSVIKERSRGRMKPSDPVHCHHEPNTILPALLPSLGCPSTPPYTPWGQGLSVINPWVSTFYSVIQAENIPGVFVMWFRNGSDVQMQCTSSYLLIIESLLGTVQSQFFQGWVESAPLTLVRRESSFSDLQIVPQLIITGESLCLTISPSPLMSLGLYAQKGS